MVFFFLQDRISSPTWKLWLSSMSLQLKKIPRFSLSIMTLDLLKKIWSTIPTTKSYFVFIHHFLRRNLIFYSLAHISLTSHYHLCLKPSTGDTTVQYWPKSGAHSEDVFVSLEYNNVIVNNGKFFKFFKLLII